MITLYDLEINNRAFKAIKEKRKAIEIRVTKINSDFDYLILKANDFINFISYDGEKITCLITKINWYQTIEELLTREGTKYTLSSTDDFNEGVKSIKNFDGYSEGIKINGVYAIHIQLLENWKFGIANNKLIELVLSGNKRATTSLYGVDNIPMIGSYSIITYDNDEYACLIKTTNITITEFKNITAEMAAKEGEGDKSLEYYRNVHIAFFKAIDTSFNDDSKVIFEEFEVEYIYKN